MDKNLVEIRKKIDRIDREIIKLLSRRMELSLRSRNLKRMITDPHREEEVFANVTHMSRSLARVAFSRKLYREIIDESKRVQEEPIRTIGFQGEHGAYSEVAALCYDPEFIPIPCVEFNEVFEAVSGKELDYGIVPVENSLEGAITPVIDLLLETHLKITGEITLPIRHCALTLPETQYNDIKVIASHPQALAQCRNFITKHGLQTHPFYDTAGAARVLSERRYPSAGVLASELCAELYGLCIITEDAADHPSNNTRFVILAREPGKEQGDKCSVVFSIKHESGTLFKILKIFSDAEINLTRIESRPVRNDSHEYSFLLDFLGNIKDEPVTASIEELRSIALTFKFLGCYRGG